MTQVPTIRVGQIWQCRDQNRIVKVTSVQDGVMYYIYSRIGIPFDMREPVKHRAITWSVDCIPPTGNNMRAIDLTVLLYDPTGA